MWYIILMMNEMTFEVSWAYGETTFINARDEAHAERVAWAMAKANGLGEVLSVLDATIVPVRESIIGM